MTGIITDMMMSVATRTCPVDRFEKQFAKYKEDFELTENEFVEMWRTCSEFFLDNAPASFGSLVTLSMVEKLLRQVPEKDRAIWRAEFVERDRERRIAVFEQLFRKRKTDYADDIFDAMSASLFPILDAIKKFAKKNISHTAIGILRQRYDLVAIALQEVNEDVLLALRANQ